MNYQRFDAGVTKCVMKEPKGACEKGKNKLTELHISAVKIKINQSHTITCTVIEISAKIYRSILQSCNHVLHSFT